MSVTQGSLLVRGREANYNGVTLLLDHSLAWTSSRCQLDDSTGGMAMVVVAHWQKGFSVVWFGRSNLTKPLKSANHYQSNTTKPFLVG